MKKILLMVAILLISVTSFGQSYDYNNYRYQKATKKETRERPVNSFIWTGVNSYDVDAGDSTPVGLDIGVTLGNVYLNLASNYAAIDAYYPYDTNITSFNIGYSFPTRSNSIIYTPYIGYYGAESYNYMENGLNVGGLVQFRMTDGIYPYIGLATGEGFKVGLSFKL